MPIMELAEFKKQLHGTMQDVLLDVYHDYMESVKMSADPEVKRKCVSMHITTIGAEHKEKVDPAANLPVFNFTFTSSGMTMSADVQPQLADPEVIDVQPKGVMETPITDAPSADTLATLSISMLNPAARAALNRDVDFSDDLIGEGDDPIECEC